MLPRRAVKTLVVHAGAIGDFLLACPTIAELAKQGAVELAGNRARLELLVAANIAQAAHDLERIEFHSLFAEPSAALRAFLKDFDRVIVWMRDEDGAIRRGLAACGVARVEVFPGLPDARWTQHASAYYARCLGYGDLLALRLRIAPTGPRLDIVLHPGSGSARKNWPIENYIALAEEHRARKRAVTWCVGPAEIEGGLAAKLVGDVLTCDALVDLAGRLATARQFVGNDSGITHLTAALGVPTVAIFGPTTNPHIWAPRGDHVRVATGKPWPDLEEIFLLSS